MAFCFMLSVNLRAQNLRYSECDGCDNSLDNEFTGSMEIPENGWDYQVAQTLNDNPHRVASDFGRREEGSNWHIGLDFSPQNGNLDLGDILYPIETGSINNIFVSLNNGNYKSIVVDGNHYFGYGHIFFNGLPNDEGMRCGAFILLRMDEPYSEYYSASIP